MIADHIQETADGDDVEDVARVIRLKPVTAVAPNEIEVRLPIQLGPDSYIMSYEVTREDDTVVLKVWTSRDTKS